jgi:transcriptional antiterminator RfaH
MIMCVENKSAWYCVRSQLKREHIAASQLRIEPDIEVFLPRIRFKRNTRQGPAWVTEALFPNYLFARFNLDSTMRKVQYARGVCGVIHFANHYPAIPDEVINDLRIMMDESGVKTLNTELNPGDEVQIASGAFKDLKVVIHRVMPGRQRVIVLMDILGQQTPTVLEIGNLILERDGKSLAA